MNIMPLLRNLHHCHLPLHNSVALPHIHELFKRPEDNIKVCLPQDRDQCSHEHGSELSVFIEGVEYLD